MIINSDELGRDIEDAVSSIIVLRANSLSSRGGALRLQ